MFNDIIDGQASGEVLEVGGNPDLPADGGDSPLHYNTSDQLELLLGQKTLRDSLLQNIESNGDPIPIEDQADTNHSELDDPLLNLKLGQKSGNTKRAIISGLDEKENDLLDELLG